jgi:hypothetical protein
MADLNFPNPGVQQTYSFVGKTWNWDGQRWAFASSGSGITKLNELTSSVQNFLIGYSGTFPNIVSSGSDHTFNFPLAGIAATGLVNTSAQSFAGAKTFASTTDATYIGAGGVVVHGGIAISGNAAIGGSAIFTNTSNANTIAIRAGVQANTLTYVFPIGSPTSGQILSASAPASGVVTLTWADDQIGAPAGGIQSLNGLVASTQTFQTGTSGTDFVISSNTSTHTFNLPDAGASARGVITTGTQTIAGAKTFSSSIIGNLTGTATTSENVNVTTTTRSLTHYLTFTNQTSGSGLGLTTSAVGVGFTVNPAQNTLAAGTFIGNLSGTAATATNFYGTLVGNSSTATTSQNVNVNTTTAGGSFFLTFTNQSSGSGLALTTSTIGIGFTVNPAQNTLAAGTFIGNLSGTAATATNFYGTHIGNVTGTATTSQNVNVTTTTAGGSFYLTFTNQSSGSGLALTTSAIGIGFTVNPAQNTLAAGTFIGNLSGTAVTATNFFGTLTGNSSTATTSANLNTVAATTGTGHYLLFSPVNGASGVAVSSDAQLQFSPSTNVLAVDVFSGNLSATGATVTSILDVQGDAALGNATGDTVTFNARIGSHFNSTTDNTYDLGLPSFRWRNAYLVNITGTAVTATNFYGSLTGNVTGTATTAQNINVNTTTAGGSFFLTFTNQSSGSGLALTTSTIGIGFTVNPAQNTLAAGTFIGNLSGIAATATNFYGTHIGNLTGTATTSENVNVTTTTRSLTHYILFANATNGSGLALTTSAVGVGFTVNPAQNTLAAGTFIGNLSGIAATATNFYGSLTGNVTGTATTSQNVNVTTTTAGGSFYLTFTNQSSGSGLALTTSTIGIGFTVNPAQNTLAAGTFIGNLSGTAATATNFYGTHIGNVTGTATTSENVNVTTTTRSLTHYILFANATNGSGLALTTSSVGVGFTVNPAQNTLAAGTFIGNLSGTAVTATNFYGTLTGNSSTATTSQNVNTVAATTGTGHYLLFSPVNGGSGIAVSSDAQLQFSPATNVLTADTFSGNLSGTAATATNFYGSLVGTATTSQNVNVTTTTRSLTHYLTFTDQTSGSGLALTTSTVGIGFTVNPAQNTLAAGTFIGNLSGTAVTATNFYGTLTGNVTGTATTAQNINVNTTTSGIDHYLLFSNRSSGSGVALTTSIVGMGLTYNPATNTLSAQFFTGTATTARNVDVTSTTINSTHYLTFTNTTSGSGLALTTSTVGVGLTYNPAQNTLGAGTFVGNVSGAATTSTFITGILRNASYVQGDLLAGASLGNTLTRLPVGATNRYFLKPDSTTQSGLGWSTFAGVFVTSLAPASPAFTLLEGDLWYKVDDGSFNVYYTDVDETAQWVEIVSAGAGGGGGAGAAGGSAFEVQYNSGGVLDGDPNLVWGPSTPSLQIKGFPVDAQTGCALQILGPSKTLTSSTGTFLGMNSASGYAGVFIEVRNNDVMKFTVEDDGATYIANLTSNGTVYSNSGYLTNSNPSDQNLKENIQSMIGGTSIVNQLNPVSFEWKSDKNGTGTKYGFIAQEVQEIIPDIVSTDSSGTIGLDTVSLIPFLVKSIKEQQETIDQLRAEIQFIKTELGL